MSLFILLLGYVAAASLFTGVAGKACVIATMAALIGYRLKVSGRSWEAAGWGKVEPPKEIAYAAACAGAVWAVSFLLLPADANQGSLASHVQDDLKTSSGWRLTFLSMCVLTGIKEELVYRGGLRAFLPDGDVKFVLISSAVFAAGHWLSGPAAYAVYALTGAVFAWTLVLSGSLRAVMLAHVLATPRTSSASVIGSAGSWVGAEDEITIIRVPRIR